MVTCYLSILLCSKFTVDRKSVIPYTVDMLLENMITGRFRPKFRELAERRSQTKADISRMSGIPYQTVQSYYNSGEDLKGVRLNTLYAYLRGAGFTDEEILGLTLGELFDIVDEEE